MLDTGNVMWNGKEQAVEQDGHLYLHSSFGYFGKQLCLESSTALRLPPHWSSRSEYRAVAPEPATLAALASLAQPPCGVQWRELLGEKPFAFSIFDF